MRKFILTMLMTIPLMGMAVPKAPPSMRNSSQNKVTTILQTPTRFGMFAKVDYQVSGLDLVITCGTVNAVNHADGYQGDNFYFNTYFKTPGQPNYISTEFFSIEDLQTQFFTVEQMPEDDPRREVTTGFKTCLYKMR